MALAAPVRPAERVEAEVVQATAALVLVRAGERRLVVGLEPGATLAGVGNVQELRRGDRVRLSPAREEGGVRFVTALERLPAVGTQPEWSIELGALLPLLAQRPAGGRPALLDLRSARAFERAHLPGASSAAEWRTRLAAVLPEHRDAPVVLYASSSQDPDGPEALRAALRLGYGKTRLYAGGYREWADGNRPTLVRARDLAKRLGTEPIVVLDVRPPEEVSRGSLPRSVAVVPAAMNSREWVERPAMPTLVLVGRDGDDPVPLEVAEQLRLWQPSAESIPPGTIQVLEGGFAAWASAGDALEPARPSLEDVPCVPVDGELCAAEFARLWREGGSGDSPLLLDVRSAASAYRPGWARHVPLAELGRRLSELPRDREIVVFCARGVTSQVAQAILARAGFRARFVRLPAPRQP